MKVCAASILNISCPFSPGSILEERRTQLKLYPAEMQSRMLATDANANLEAANPRMKINTERKPQLNTRDESSP